MPALFDIPLEIRLNIDRHALTVDGIDVCSKGHSNGLPLLRLLSHPHSHMRLICRQMKDEISGLRMPKLDFSSCSEAEESV